MSHQMCWVGSTPASCRHRRRRGGETRTCSRGVRCSGPTSSTCAVVVDDGAASVRAACGARPRVRAAAPSWRASRPRARCRRSAVALTSPVQAGRAGTRVEQVVGEAAVGGRHTRVSIPDVATPPRADQPAAHSPVNGCSISTWYGRRAAAAPPSACRHRSRPRRGRSRRVCARPRRPQALARAADVEAHAGGRTISPVRRHAHRAPARSGCGRAGRARGAERSASASGRRRHAGARLAVAGRLERADQRRVDQPAAALRRPHAGRDRARGAAATPAPPSAGRRSGAQLAVRAKARQPRVERSTTRAPGAAASAGRAGPARAGSPTRSRISEPMAGN